MGASIASDFWKKAAQPVKTVRAPTKSCRNGTNVSNGVPSGIAQVRLDIKIPDKVLTDAGMLLIAEALVAALKARPDLCLSELDLSGNDLTIKSMIGIAQIVEHSPDLHVLNLSKNRIAVVDMADGVAFASFCSACWDCRVLNRLDLSNNPNLGTLALEVLARVAIRAQQLVDVRGNLRQESCADSETTLSGAEVIRQPNTLESPHKQLKSGRQSIVPLEETQSPSQQQPTADRVLALGSIGLEDQGALYLSAIIISGAARGLVITAGWAGNDKTLGKDGAQLLKLTVRQAEDAKLLSSPLASDVAVNSDPSNELDGSPQSE